MKSKLKNKRFVQAVLYVRVSSKGQEKEGFSIPAQLKLLRNYGQTQGFQIVREFRDVETAKKSGREGFGEMVDFLIKNSNCKYLLVEKTDRLYRNFKDYVCLEDIGIEIHLVKEGAIVSNNSKSAEKFIHGIKVLMAKNYIDNLSEETRKGMTEKAEQGIWPSIAPVGYKNVLGKSGKRTIKPDSQMAPVVIRLFKTYSSGNYSLEEITEKFRAKRLVLRDSKRPLPRSTVYKILSNQIYSGKFKWKESIYQGKYTPLISEKLWEKVQGKLRKRSKW
jgi:DNA invertase Pin-like site-specific DNA recombinase